MANFELKEMIDMVEFADTNDHGVVSFSEFAEVYGSPPWLRVQAASRILDEITAAWKMIDLDGISNSVK